MENRAKRRRAFVTAPEVPLVLELVVLKYPEPNLRCLRCRRRTVKHRLSKRLGPKAKQLFLQRSSGGPISVLAKVASSIDQGVFRRDVASLGGEVNSWMDEISLVAIQINPEDLNELADL